MNNTLFLTVFTLLSLQCLVSAHSLHPVTRQATSCTRNEDCNEGFIFPVLQCVNGICQNPSTAAPPPPPAIQPSQSGPTILSFPKRKTTGVDPVDGCTSIRQCTSGMVCVSGKVKGTCEKLDDIIGLSHLLVNLVQEDYTPQSATNPSGSNAGVASQPGPLYTSRAMAIVYLAAHDAYALLTNGCSPKIRLHKYSTIFSQISDLKTRSKTQSSSSFENQARFASLAAGFQAAKLLYPASASIIDNVQNASTKGADPLFIKFGATIGKLWFNIRENDGSKTTHFDDSFEFGKLLAHHPDPNYPIVQNTSNVQRNRGRHWGKVRPFILSNVRKQAYLEKYPGIDTKEYRQNLEEVTKIGQCNDLKDSKGNSLRDIGIFWGYDGAINIGVPPRLYLQVVLAVKELHELSFKQQLRALTAVGVSMADAGIAAWLWKFEYDLWRPVLGIRNDTKNPVPGWNPVGVALSNVVAAGTPKEKRPPYCVGLNPDFPAYPSGHATFGTAAFKTLSTLLSKDPSDITVTFTSDEFNGRTVEGTTGKRRRVFTQTISLQEAIEQNKDSRVNLGVHWRFDSDGGDIVGNDIAEIAANAFHF